MLCVCLSFIYTHRRADDSHIRHLHHLKKHNPTPHKRQTCNLVSIAPKSKINHTIYSEIGLHRIAKLASAIKPINNNNNNKSANISYCYCYCCAHTFHIHTTKRGGVMGSILTENLKSQYT